MNSIQHPVRPRGFALVVTLSLMILLTIIAVGLLSLSSISLRASSRADLQQQARQNARLALNLAIGQLQTYTGPDQRISAPARIRGASAARPHLTGVWQGWKWDGQGTPGYKDKKDSQFLHWLTSSREPGAADSVDYVKNAPTGSTAKLVPENTTSPERDQVDAEIITLSNSSKTLGQGVAWAVFDESTKLPTALPEPSATSLTSNMHRMSAAPLPGYASTTLRNWDPISLLADSRKKLITTEQSGLIGMPVEDRSFHDLTSRTAGVIADVGNGGLAKDLTRLFSSSTSLPSSYSGRFLYSDTNTPLVPPPTRFNGANPFPSPDPSWNLLYSHYRMYDKLGGGLNPVISTTTTARPPAGSTGNAVLNSPYFKNQQIVPAIAKAQFVFSMGFGWHPTMNAFTTPQNAALPDSDPKKDLYITWLVIDPVITLWNPYNVNLRFTGGRIDLYRVPLMFRIYKNGKLINAEYTHIANCFVSTDFANRANTYFRLNLLPPSGSNDIMMAPGEHIVFSATNHVKTFQNQFSEVGVELRPGFKPPAGNASDPEVGGVSSLNVCVSSNGSNSGIDYGKSVRSVAVKPGDVIQLDVKQGRAAVDKPKETGGKEVSGFLKYYVGNPSSPTLVGGIELDYGDNEAEYFRLSQVTTCHPSSSAMRFRRMPRRTTIRETSRLRWSASRSLS